MRGRGCVNGCGCGCGFGVWVWVKGVGVGVGADTREGETDRQTEDRQTDRQTDRQKMTEICIFQSFPSLIRQGFFSDVFLVCCVVVSGEAP